MRWTADQLSRLAQLSADAADLAPQARAAWAIETARRYPDLADAITAMAADTPAPDAPAVTLGADPDEADAHAGDAVGPYRLLRLLGRGGMGSVWLAEQVDGRVQRQVALKLLANGQAQRSWRLRFERERDILAHLDHPGIARLIDAGTAADGRPYLAMAYVSGQDIVSHARARALDARACVRLVLQLLAAVQHAHAVLVVHRDLKPANILVDDAGTVVLLDFGIAKLVEPAAPADAPSAVTALAGPALTLDYASPEQVAGRPVGAASDVYSAGVVLYELLSGRRPYRLRRGSRAEMEEAILAQDIAPPSQRVDAALAPTLGSSPRRLARELRGDLDAIVLKALAREPAQRYASAQSLADDLRRWLEGLPVQAQGLSAWYVTGRLVRRHRWAVAGATAVLASLGAGLGLALWQAELTRQEALAARATEQFLVQLFRANAVDQDDPAEAQLTTAATLLERGTQRLASGLQDAPATRLRLLDTLIALNRDLAEVDNVDALQAQRLAWWRAHRAHDTAGLAAVLIDAGRATTAGSKHPQDAPALLHEAGQALERAGTPADSPLRGHLALARAQAAGDDQCAAVKQAREATRLLRGLPATDPWRLEALLVHAVSAAYCGDRGEAVPVGEQALAQAQALHRLPDIEAAHTALAMAYSREGRPGAAIAQARAALQVAQSKHPKQAVAGADVLTAGVYLTGLLRDYGHPGQAAQQAGALLQRAGTPPKDPDSATGLWISLARAQRELGDLAAARRSIDQGAAVLASFEAEPGQRLMLLDAQADILSAAGQWQQAEALFQEAARLHAEHHHFGTPQAYPHLARRLQHELRAGRVAQARQPMAQFEVRDPGPGGSTRRHIERNVLQAEIAAALHDWAAAEALTRAAVAEARRYAEPDQVHDLLARALEGQAQALRGLRRAAEAEPLAAEALALRRQMAAPSDPA